VSGPAHTLGRQFHTTLTTGDWQAIRSLLHDDATWTLPGDNTISGTAAGGDAVPPSRRSARPER
jgi:hypothetical protein